MADDEESDVNKENRTRGPAGDCGRMGNKWMEGGQGQKLRTRDLYTVYWSMCCHLDAVESPGYWKRLDAKKDGK